MRLWWWLRRNLARREPDTTAEARECLRRLAERDEQVQRLAVELREAQRHNHFSAMVAVAIRRGAREGGEQHG